MMTNTPPFVRGRRLALFTSAGIAALAISTPAFAQDADETISDEQAEAAPEQVQRQVLDWLAAVVMERAVEPDLLAAHQLLLLERDNHIAHDGERRR